MKVCTNCERINQDKEETCIGCGCDDFRFVVFAPYDDIEPYLEARCTEHTQA